jgi:exopolysaccharide biosynthesis polyprenyl glycosylphosphotransferase
MLRFNIRYQLFFALSDVMLVILAMAGSVALVISRQRLPIMPANVLLVTVLAILVWLLLFARNHVYYARPGLRLLHTYNQLINQHVIATFTLMGILYIVLPTYPRTYVIVFSAVLLVLLLSHRTLVFALRRRLHPWINSIRRVVIIGNDDYAVTVGDYVRDCLPIGLQLVGFVSVTDMPGDSKVAPILGTLSKLDTVLNETAPDEIIVSVRWLDQATMQQIDALVMLVQNTPIHVRIAPDLSQLVYIRSHAENFNGLTLISVREPALSPLERLVKRAFDIGFSLIVLVFTLPFYPLIALAIKLDSPGPAIFRQQRVGQYGKPFTIYKFRTMIENAQEIPNGFAYHKSPDDPRVTRVGRWLRRLSLDELPQFINVLRGDMSVVGPRPELVSIVDSFSAWHRKRLEVPQGITGWWQINGRADFPLFYHVEDDLYYIENYSIWLDVLIIVRTLVAVIQRRGAY